MRDTSAVLVIQVKMNIWDLELCPGFASHETYNAGVLFKNKEYKITNIKLGA